MELLENYKRAYYLGKPIISDQKYDKYVTEMQDLGHEIPVGTSCPKGNMVPLPWKMGSLSFVKTVDELEYWVESRKGPFMLSEKLDGVSATYTNGKLYSRGDGTHGQDITHILPYIDTSRKFPLAARGELIFPKTACTEMGKKPTTVVAGLVNAKTLTKERKKLLRKVRFVSYESYNFDLSIENSIAVWHKVLTAESLIQQVNDLSEGRKSNGKYHLDGIVITDLSKRGIYHSSVPSWSIAYKPEYIFSEKIQTKVKSVEWNVSVNNRLIPTVLYNEVTSSIGNSYNRVSGYNALYVKENGIGPGATIEIVISCNVNIGKVVKSVEVEMPSGEWRPPHLYQLEETQESKARVFDTFFSTIGVERIRRLTLFKLAAKYETIFEVIENLNNVSDVIGVENGASFHKQVLEIFSKPILEWKLVVGSNIYGTSIGVERAVKLTQKFPRILTGECKPTEDDIRLVPLFGPKTSVVTAKHLKKLRKWYRKLANSVKQQYDIGIVFDTPTVGKIYVFTGGKPAGAVTSIEKLGGVIENNVTRKTDFLVVSSDDCSSKKYLLAKKYEKKIIHCDSLL